MASFGNGARGLARCGQSQGDRTDIQNQETGGSLLDPPLDIKVKDLDHDGGRKYVFHNRFFLAQGGMPR
ncbi:hypothetical protein Q7C36_016938 [Tachysurus vachellii]|uniref:Uncharacterized protein n=1 Tax=Tachysurus vachellii TaxID=175792 RepID=A0AA88SBK9_TACVA|nr:hypothetical protein Q7C36_016938 [Tachysurus vachellii]